MCKHIPDWELQNNVYDRINGVHKSLNHTLMGSQKLQASWGRKLFGVFFLGGGW